VALAFVPFTRDLEDAAREFNRRMREKNAPTDFLLPTDATHKRSSSPAIQWQQYVVVDGDQIRGGVLEMNQPGWLNGRELRAVNFQSPLSEGIADGQNVMVGMQMVKFMQKRSEAVFIVGMGSPNNPLPRLLKAAGWTVNEVPFFFRVHRPRAFFRELRPLHSTRARSFAAKLAAISGVGGVGLSFKQRRKARPDVSLTSESSWGNWADRVWENIRSNCTFAVRRDRETLTALYDPTDKRISIFQAKHNGSTVGWAVCQDTQMKDNRYFGNLRVASIIDCVAEPDKMAATATAVDDEMRSRGTDLILVNHSHASWIEAFRSAGFLPGPSNYLVGMSKSLGAALQSIEGGVQRVHITRGDGDGRLHL